MDDNLTFIMNDLKDPSSALIHYNLYTTPKKAEQQHREFLDKYIQGDPKPTKYFTVDEMRQLGFVGLYKHPSIFDDALTEFINSF